MSEYKICMGYITHDIYDTYEDSEGHHQGQQIGSDTIDDPYYIVMEDNAELETFDDYHKAKDYMNQIKNHNKLDVDYCDDKKMWEIIKYDGYHGEWKETGVYSDNAENLREIVRITEGK